jgi:hypothetical protein
MAKLILLTLFIVSSCSMIPDRTFYSQMDEMNQPMNFFNPHDDFTVIPGDAAHGYRTSKEVNSRTPATEVESKREGFSLSLKRELYELELMQPERKLKHYSKYKHLLRSTSAKIYFLKMATLSERQEYLGQSGLFRNRLKERDRAIAAVFQDTKDVLMGMSKSEVIDTWGSPFRVDVSGNPSMQNERWAYRVENEVKLIYFEHGRVGGWVTQ